MKARSESQISDLGHMNGGIFLLVWLATLASGIELNEAVRERRFVALSDGYRSRASGHATQHETDSSKMGGRSLKLHRDLSVMKGIASHTLPFLPVHEVERSLGSTNFLYILVFCFLSVIGIIIGAAGVVLLMHRMNKPTASAVVDPQFEVFSARDQPVDKKHPGCTRIV